MVCTAEKKHGLDRRLHFEILNACFEVLMETLP